MIDLTFPNVLDLFDKYRDENRTNSAAFLIWYLENYYRLDDLEAIDSVCDQRGDKGVDGIYLNESDGTIDVFQTKLTEKVGRTLGDSALKEFYGSLQQFKNKDSIKALLDSDANTQLKGIINRLNLIKIIDIYEVRGFFISNMDIDDNGKEYLKHVNNITVIGKDELQNSYISSDRENKDIRVANLSLGESEYLRYSVDANVFALIAPVKAKELVGINGIENQDIFAYNVRGHLGGTKVNKDIIASIKNSALHNKFPLFHNGITVVCDKINIDENNQRINIENFYVVNGCQSLTTLYSQQRFISENLNILVKFVQVGADADLSKMITHYSNNQNGVKARDFKSNSTIQVRLKNELEQRFSDYCFEVKRGEAIQDKILITNEESGLLMMAFDLKEPWGTHRKYQVFDDKYNELFARPEVTASRIILLDILNKNIKKKIESIENKLVAKYVLTKYALLYILREILEKDDVGRELLKKPDNFVESEQKRDKLNNVVDIIMNDIIIDFNAEVKSLDEDFDYKSKLREESWVKDKAKEIVGSYQKQVARNRIDSFGQEWNK